MIAALVSLLVTRQPLSGCCWRRSPSPAGVSIRRSARRWMPFPTSRCPGINIRTTYPGQAPPLSRTRSLSADHHHAVGTGREDRARLFVLR